MAEQGIRFSGSTYLGVLSPSRNLHPQVCQGIHRGSGALDACQHSGYRPACLGPLEGGGHGR